MSSTLSCEQTAEDSRAELEALDERGAGALRRWVLGSPRSQMLFRPEEVDRGSEGVRDLAAVVRALSDPEHDPRPFRPRPLRCGADRKSTRLNSSHSQISYAVFCLKKKHNHRIH